MPRVVAFSDAQADQFRGNADSSGRSRLRTPFLASSEEDPDQPVAYFVQNDVGRVIRPHYHRFDQWQIVVDGAGTLGRHDIAPYFIQFTRAFTPYGPIADDGRSRISYIAMHTHGDSRADYMPDSRSKLLQVPGRRPWQVMRRIEFPAQLGNAGPAGVALQRIAGVSDDQGLYACSLSMAPNAQARAPDPAPGDGQYLVIVKGGLRYGDRDYRAYAIVYLEPDEGPFQVCAGAEGLNAIIVNFPDTGRRASDRRTPAHE